ncbi:MAG: LLM class flavin-dependent oxidoreductase [Caldilineaceae bacterium]
MCAIYFANQRSRYPPNSIPAGGDSLRWSILRAEIPFLLGSWGEATIKACRDDINEIKIGGSANPDVIPYFRKILTPAAGAIGRDEVGICIGAVCVVDEDGAAARAHVKREVALYLPVVAELDPTVELDPELVARLKTAAATYDFDGAARLISDDLLRRFAFAGTPCGNR